MGFVDFLAYIRRMGKNELVFFPSKTDLISIADKDGNATDEMLSERLGKIQNTIDKTDSVLDKATGTCNIELKDSTNADILSAYNIAAITDSNGYTVVETDKLITNADGTYSVEPGTIVYCGNIIDAPEETVGYYRCIKKVISEYPGDLIFTYTQESFGKLEYFEYLGNTSIGEEFYTAQGEQAKLSCLESDVRAIENNMAVLEEAPCITLDLENASDDIKKSFGYLGTLDSTIAKWSGGSSGGYITEGSYRKNGIVYVPSAFSVSTSVYKPNGQRITVDFKKGYYKYFGGDKAGIIASITQNGISGMPAYFGETVALKVYNF